MVSKIKTRHETDVNYEINLETHSVKQKSIHKNAWQQFFSMQQLYPFVIFANYCISCCHRASVLCIQQATLQTHNLRVVTCRKKRVLCCMMKTNVYLINKSCSLDTMMMAMCNSSMCWSQIVHDDRISFQNELKTKTQWRWWQLLRPCYYFWGNVISYAG